MNYDDLKKYNYVYEDEKNITKEIKFKFFNSLLDKFKRKEEVIYKFYYKNINGCKLINQLEPFLLNKLYHDEAFWSDVTIDFNETEWVYCPKGEYTPYTLLFSFSSELDPEINSGFVSAKIEFIEDDENKWILDCFKDYASIKENMQVGVGKLLNYIYFQNLNCNLHNINIGECKKILKEIDLKIKFYNYLFKMELGYELKDLENFNVIIPIVYFLYKKNYSDILESDLKNSIKYCMLAIITNYFSIDDNLIYFLKIDKSNDYMENIKKIIIDRCKVKDSIKNNLFKEKKDVSNDFIVIYECFLIHFNIRCLDTFLKYSNSINEYKIIENEIDCLANTYYSYIHEDNINYSLYSRYERLKNDQEKDIFLDNIYNTNLVLYNTFIECKDDSTTRILEKYTDGIIGNFQDFIMNYDDCRLSNHEIDRLIAIGESDTVEFKENAFSKYCGQKLCDDETKKECNKKLNNNEKFECPKKSDVEKCYVEKCYVEGDMSYDILKAICAFANTKGGHLFIGVNDHGEKVGHSIDYKSIQSENELRKEQDEFQRKLHEKIKNCLFNSPRYNIDFYNLKDAKNDICLITVYKNYDLTWVYHEKEKEKGYEFFIRLSGASESKHFYELKGNCKDKEKKINTEKKFMEFSQTLKNIFK